MVHAEARCASIARSKLEACELAGVHNDESEKIDASKLAARVQELGTRDAHQATTNAATTIQILAAELRIAFLHIASAASDRLQSMWTWTQRSTDRSLFFVPGPADQHPHDVVVDVVGGVVTAGTGVPNVPKISSPDLY